MRMPPALRYQFGTSGWPLGSTPMLEEKEEEECITSGNWRCQHQSTTPCCARVPRKCASPDSHLSLVILPPTPTRCPTSASFYFSVSMNSSEPPSSPSPSLPSPLPSLSSLAIPSSDIFYLAVYMNSPSHLHSVPPLPLTFPLPLPSPLSCTRSFPR